MAVTYITATGEEVSKIVSRIENVVHGEQNSHISIGCLVVAILAQRPDIPPELLMSAVKGASEWLAAYIFSDLENGVVN